MWLPFLVLSVVNDALRPQADKVIKQSSEHTDRAFYHLHTPRLVDGVPLRLLPVVDGAVTNL